MPSETWNCQLQMKFSIKFFSTQISIVLLTNLTSAAKVMPNSPTKFSQKLSCLLGLPVLWSNMQSLEELWGTA